MDSFKKLTTAPSLATRTCKHFRLVVWMLLLAVTVGAPSFSAEPQDQSDDYWSRRTALDQAYRNQLRVLAGRCRELNLPDQARITESWATPRDPRRQYLFLPQPADSRRPAADAAKIVQQWYARWMQDRSQQAERLFQLARHELEQDRPARTYQLLHEVLHENPDHATARQALGYRQVSGRWAKPTSVIRAKQIRTGNSMLGFTSGPYWVVDSENFSIATSHSEQAGIAVAERLETLHAVWRQLFFRYWSNADALARRIEGQAGGPRRDPRHQVVLYRDREQYVTQLQRVQPQIELTVGIYMDTKSTAYFYAQDAADPSIYYHEVTHQLFSETGQVAPAIGADDNFWIIEGIALYMESLQTNSEYCTVGGIGADRLQYARYRAFTDRFYVPLGQLVVLGRQALQAHPEIRRLYSQSAGLAAMLMDHQQGLYREALVDYLLAVYSGRDRAGTLASLCDIPLTDLDAQYLRFLNVSDTDLSHLPSTHHAINLSLGHTSVTDIGLQYLADQRELQWLDLAHLPITDAGFSHLKAAEKLNHLNLEQTRITDATLDIVSGFRDLQILDLTGTRITDEGLARLAKLSKLRELWIGNTAVSDTGLERLRGLKALATLDIGGSQVTADGWKRIRTALPLLEE